MMKNNKAENKKFKIIAGVAAAVVVVIALAAVLVFKIGADRTVRDGNITSFSFSHGSFWSGDRDYVLTKQDNLALLTEKCMGCRDSFEVSKTVDGNYLGEVADIIEKYEIAKWDGFDESDNVTDGEGFTLKVTYDDGKSIEAHGYMKFPTNYKEARDEFDKLFEKLR